MRTRPAASATAKMAAANSTITPRLPKIGAADSQVTSARCALSVTAWVYQYVGKNFAAV